MHDVSDWRRRFTPFCRHFAAVDAACHPHSPGAERRRGIISYLRLITVSAEFMQPELSRQRDVLQRYEFSYYSIHGECAKCKACQLDGRLVSWSVSW